MKHSDSTSSTSLRPENSVAILCIGTELTRGELVNSNAAWLAEQLVASGFLPLHQWVIDDDDARIGEALAELSKRAAIIVSTGGLGPTTDDRTASATAMHLGVPMVRDEASLQTIRDRFAKLGRPMSPSNQKQADFPQGADILTNPVGSAPGFSVVIGAEHTHASSTQSTGDKTKLTPSEGARAFFMPGVPREMKKMFREQVLPRIQNRGKNNIHQIRMRTFGLPESVVGEKLAGIEETNPGVTIGYRAHFPEIEVKVLATHDSDAENYAERVAAEVRGRLGAVVFGGERDSFAGVTVAKLAEKQWQVALAESCTGGLATQMLTRIAGASKVLLGGVVAYDNALKIDWLGVDPTHIETHGAVSEVVALSMAEGIRRKTKAQIGIGITGIAGPSGGTPEKPVGTVYVACSTEQQSVCEQLSFAWEREQIQTIASYVALRLIQQACS
jgi:nicotinamide-nucleotide amidase